MTSGPDFSALQVGRIPFLVCAPYFHASLRGFPGVAFTDGPPQALNKLLAVGLVDCAPSSSFEYARGNAGLAAEYLLVPGLCTSGRGEVKSVLLFSREPWEALDGRTILLSPDSDTSNALVRVLCRFRFGVEPTFQAAVESVETLSGPSAKVAIGDAALREAASGQWPHRYDLARVWQEWRGTPLPLGVWILRADAARAKEQTVRNYVRHLRDSLRAFFDDPTAGLDAWQQAYGLPLSRAAALDFYSTADYALTAAHARALEDFFALCHEAGLLPSAPALRWWGGEA
jgi:chorismate dehydratase